MNKTLIVMLLCIVSFTLGYLFHGVVSPSEIASDCNDVHAALNEVTYNFFNHLSWNCIGELVESTTQRAIMIELLDKNCTLMKVR